MVFSNAYYDSCVSVTIINLEIKGQPPYSPKAEARILIAEQGRTEDCVNLVHLSVFMNNNESMVISQAQFFPVINNNDAHRSTVSTVNSFHELSFYILLFIGITDQDKYKEKQFLSWILLHNFIIKIIAKKTQPNNGIRMSAPLSHSLSY